MPLGQYLLGAAFFVFTSGAIGAASALVLARRFGGLEGSPRALAFALLWLAGIVAAELLPAAATVLSRGSVLVTALLILLAAWRLTPAAAANGASTLSRPLATGSRLSTVLAVTGAGAVAIVTLAYLAGAARFAVEGNDFLTFTMPNLGRWIQSGSLWMSNQFTPLIQTSTYPNNGDLFLLSALLPWHDDALVRLVNVPLYALIGLSVYALAIELGARRATSLLFAALVLSIQDVSLPALGDIKSDTFMLATFGIGLLFLVRHHRTRARADLLLAGLGLGLAFGARWYGISTVAVVVVVWLAASLLAGVHRRVVFRDAGVLGVVIVLAGGFWLVRNWVVTGNPLYPVSVGALGFSAPHDPFVSAYDSTVVHYLLAGRFFSDLLPLYKYGVGIPGAILAGSGVLALGVAVATAGAGSGSVRRAGDRAAASAPTALALLAAAAAIAFAYAITPGSAQGPVGEPVLAPGNARWALGAAMPAAAVSAWAASRLGAAGLVFEVAALVGIGFGLHQQFSGIPAIHFADAAAILAVVAAALAASSVLRRSQPRTRRRGLATAAGITAVALVAAGFAIERRVDRTRYADLDPALRWLVTRAPAGHRVGIAGDWSGTSANWPAFGPRLGNRTGYVGYTVDHMLVEYDRRVPFSRAVEHGGYDLIVLGRGFHPGRPFARSSPFSSTSVAQQAAWIGSLGYKLVASGFYFLVYRRA